MKEIRGQESKVGEKVPEGPWPSLAHLQMTETQGGRGGSKGPGHLPTLSDQLLWL